MMTKHLKCVIRKPTATQKFVKCSKKLRKRSKMALERTMIARKFTLNSQKALNLDGKIFLTTLNILVQKEKNKFANCLDYITDDVTE